MRVSGGGATSASNLSPHLPPWRLGTSVCSNLPHGSQALPLLALLVVLRATHAGPARRPGDAGHGHAGAGVGGILAHTRFEERLIPALIAFLVALAALLRALGSR